MYGALFVVFVSPESCTATATCDAIHITCYMPHPTAHRSCLARLHATCLLTCRTTTHTPMMSCQDRTFLPSTWLSDWSVATLYSIGQLVVCTSQGKMPCVSPSTVNAPFCLCISSREIQVAESASGSKHSTTHITLWESVDTGSNVNIFSKISEQTPYRDSICHLKNKKSTARFRLMGQVLAEWSRVCRPTGKHATVCTMLLQLVTK
jgi:hypothetical protein